MSAEKELENAVEGLFEAAAKPPLVYFLLAGGAILGGLYLRPRVHLPPLLVPLLVLGCVALLVAAGILWWRFRHLFRRQKNDIVRDWPELSEGLGLAGSIITLVKKDGIGRTYRLELNRFKGQTAQDVIAKVPRLEAALRTRHGAVRVTPDANRADRCAIKVVEKDPLAKPLAYKAPELTSITQPLTLGMFEDHSPVELKVWASGGQARHTLIAGVTGGGKSSLLNVVLGNLARCRDLVIYAVDMKGGMELSPWQGALEQLATTPAEATVLLATAIRILEARMKILAAAKVRAWPPRKDGKLTPEQPLVIIVVDELAQLEGEALGMVQRISALGRAVGVLLLLATQRPSAQQLASTDASGTALRGQCHVRIAMRVTEGREVDMILGSEYAAQGWRADRLLKEPGCFLIVDPPTHTQPRPARSYLMTDDDVAATVAACADIRPHLDEASAEAAREPTVDVTDMEGDLPADPEAALLALLHQADSDGLTVDELWPQVDRSRAWVASRLTTLVKTRQVVKPRYGRFAIPEKSLTV